MKRLWLGLVAVLVVIAIGAYFWLRQKEQPAPPPIPVVSPPEVVPPAPPAPAKPAIAYPVPTPGGVTELPPLEKAEDFVKHELDGLFTAEALKKYLLVDAFVRRVVATVDNLGRPLAPPRAWPVRITPGRFSVASGGEGSVIAAKNAARYVPFVEFVAAVDSERAVALYRKLYPLFQRAYEQLGYPGKYFNDRLVAVIDLLLETPEPAGALKVDLPKFEGPLKPTHPWVLYRFADPRYQGLASGQKMLLRMGVKNEKRLKAKLAELRKLLVAEKPSR